jgi:hypothetical protein
MVLEDRTKLTETGRERSYERNKEKRDTPMGLSLPRSVEIWSVRVNWIWENH